MAEDYEFERIIKIANERCFLPEASIGFKINSLMLD